MEESAFSVQMNILSALVLAIGNAKVCKVYERGITWTCPKLAALCPSALREIFRSRRRVHTAVDGPIDRIPDNRAFRGRAPEAGDQEARFARHSLRGECRVGKIEN